MPKKTENETEFQANDDNIEFCELILRLGNLGLSQQEVSETLGVSPGQVSRIKKGERHAPIGHLRKLRKHLRHLAEQRKAEPTVVPMSSGRSAFDVTPVILRSLSVRESVRAFRDLLWARATARGVPTTRVSISSNVNAADGGVDASIADDEGDQISDELLRSGTRYQIKTGSFAPWQRAQVDQELFGKKEALFANLGSEIQQTLQDKRRFVLVNFGVDPTDRELRKARKNFQDAFRECGYPDTTVEVWGQTQLIGLFQSYPSLCLRLRGCDHQIFRSHESWSSDDDMQPCIHYSPEQHQLIEDLRHKLHTGEFAHVRLLGEPGVGKTRLALELTRTVEFAPVTLYVKDGRSLLQSSFINELLHADDKRFILFVIDECSPRDLADIWNLLKSRSNRLRAITIDHGPDGTFDDKTHIVTVEPSGLEQILSILKDHHVGMNDARRWAEYCEGCPRVAHVIGANLNAHHSDLLASPTTSEVWRRFVDGHDDPDSEAVQLRRIVLRYVSLFERFGFEAPVKQEAMFIQKLAERCDPRITGPRFLSIIRELQGRRIIQGATTLYLTPRLLHVHLYREFWSAYGNDFDIAANLQGMPQEMLQWLMQMLRYGHDCAAVENAIERLLGYSGVFPTGRFPDTEQNGRMICVLAEACPKQTLRCLLRTIGEMDASSLRQVTKARQSLVWALEKLAVWEDCFRCASELLLDLAESENATNSNNSTGTFTGLFSLIPGWGPTQANPKVRLSVLASALDSCSIERRRLGLKACAGALETGPTHRMVGPEHQGLRPTIRFWMPATYGELWDAYRDVWNLLVDRLESWKGDDRNVLITTIIHAAWSTLHIQSLTTSVIETLDLIATDESTDVKKLVELIRRQLRHKESKIPDNARKSLQLILDRLNGSTFASTLRRFVKHVSWDDYHDDEWNDTDLVDRKLDYLAASVCSDRELLVPELSWLICEDSSPSYCFAFRIGQSDTQRAWMPLILEQYSAAADTASPSFLSGYLRAIFNRDIGEWESVMLELANAPPTAARFSDFVISSGMTDRIARRVVDQCRSGAQSKDRLQRWWFDRQLQGVGEETIKELIDLQLEDGVGALWENAVRMCHTFYLEKDKEKALPEELVFGLLTAEAMADGRVAHSAGYYWSRIARAFISKYPHREWEFFKAVLNVAASNWSVLDDLETNAEQILTTLLVKDPVTAWKMIADVFRETNEHRNFALQHWLATGGHRIIGNDAPGPIQFVPVEVLFNWVDENIEKHGYWLTQILPKTFDKSSAGRLTRDFVARYGKEKSLRSGLNSHFHSRGWCGNASDHFRCLREQARGWLRDERNGSVIGWIEEYIDGLSYDIEQAEIEEERRF